MKHLMWHPKTLHPLKLNNKACIFEKKTWFVYTISPFSGNTPVDYKNWRTGLVRLRSIYPLNWKGNLSAILILQPSRPLAWLSTLDRDWFACAAAFLKMPEFCSFRVPRVISASKVVETTLWLPAANAGAPWTNSLVWKLSGKQKQTMD
jgi:hypothetical protein